MRTGDGVERLKGGGGGGGGVGMRERECDREREREAEMGRAAPHVYLDFVVQCDGKHSK